MSKEIKDMVKELNKFFNENTGGTRYEIIIHPFNKAMSFGHNTALYNTNKDFKNAVKRLYYSMLKEEMTVEEGFTKFPSRRDKGKIVRGID